MWGGRPVGSLASHMGLLQNIQESPVLRIFLSAVERLVGILGCVVQCPCSLLTLTAPATECVVTCVSGFTLSEDWLSCNFGPFKFLCTSGTQVLVQITALYLKTYPGGAFLCASTAPVSAELDHPTHSETGPGSMGAECPGLASSSLGSQGPDGCSFSVGLILSFSACPALTAPFGAPISGLNVQCPACHRLPGAAGRSCLCGCTGRCSGPLRVIQDGHFRGTRQ